jgi:hypothetical protein
MLGHWNEVVIQALKQLDPVLPLSHDRAEHTFLIKANSFSGPTDQPSVRSTPYQI